MYDSAKPSPSRGRVGWGFSTPGRPTRDLRSRSPTPDALPAGEGECSARNALIKRRAPDATCLGISPSAGAPARASRRAPRWRRRTPRDARPRGRAIRAALRDKGWKPGKPTLVQVASARDVASFTTGAAADTADQPDAAWAAVFTGEGFDPVDGASRVATLSRAPGALFASRSTSSP